MARPEQVRRHARAHVPKPDESDFHALTSSPRSADLIVPL
jgi:hypothetical protein